MLRPRDVARFLLGFVLGAVGVVVLMDLATRP